MLVAGEGPARTGDRAHGEPGALAEELEAAGSLGGFDIIALYAKTKRYPQVFAVDDLFYALA
jgi:hypothetical protein